MVDCEDRLGYVQVNGMSTLHTQAEITCRKPTNWRGKRSLKQFITLIRDLGGTPFLVAFLTTHRNRIAGHHLQRNGRARRGPVEHMTVM